MPRKQARARLESAESTWTGPDLWRNWQAYTAGQGFQGGYEAILYSDAHVVGEIADGLEPYKIFNALGIPPAGGSVSASAGAVVRVGWYLQVRAPVDPNGPQAPRKSVTDHYVAVPLADQMACLLSLILGARFRSGGEVRDFSADPEADPAGRPSFFMHRQPALASPQRGTLLPGIAGRQVDLSTAKSGLESFFSLDPKHATAVVRAARLYRQALWVADDDGELAWLLLVSAVETAATLWHTRDTSQLDLLLQTNPELADLLRDAGGEGLVARAAELMKLNRPTAATQQFLLKFGATPPTERPPEWAQLDFSKLQKAINLIYSYRSQVLHAGAPFPGPLLEPPSVWDLEVPAEVPSGHWTQYGDHTLWMAKDLPMHFHTFAGIVRRALLAWLDELARR